MMKAIYSRINQCFFVIWHDQVISVYQNRIELNESLKYQGLQIKQDGVIESL